MEKHKLSQEIITDIAGELEMGCICYVNLDTGAYETILGDSYGCYIDEDDELYNEIFDKIDSWKNFEKIEPPRSNEAFEFMEAFVEDCVPEESPLSEQLYKALSRNKPFHNFRNAIEDNNLGEKWYAFKRQKLEKYIKDELGVYSVE